MKTPVFAGPWSVSCTGLSHWIIRRSVSVWPGVETVKGLDGRTRRFRTGQGARKALKNMGLDNS
jgi:hypothetical protein